MVKRDRLCNLDEKSNFVRCCFQKNSLKFEKSEGYGVSDVRKEPKKDHFLVKYTQRESHTHTHTIKLNGCCDS